MPNPDPGVVDWMRRHERELALDPMILGEIRFGILVLKAGRRRQRLDQWFDEGVRRIHCLAWEEETGLRWAELLAHLKSVGKAMPIKDSLIAATALTHDLALATRNRRDFEDTGLDLVDPFE